MNFSIESSLILDNTAQPPNAIHVYQHVQDTPKHITFHCMLGDDFETMMYPAVVLPINKSALHCFHLPGSKFDPRIYLHTTLYTIISQLLSKLGEGTFHNVNYKLTSPLT